MVLIGGVAIAPISKMVAMLFDDIETLTETQ